VQKFRPGSKLGHHGFAVECMKMIGKPNFFRIELSVRSKKAQADAWASDYS
jgi:hypothetical protein